MPGWIGQQLGLSWSKEGDTVRGSAVLNYLERITDVTWSNKAIKEIKNSRWRLTVIDAAKAKQFRDYTDSTSHVKGHQIDPDQWQRIKNANLTYDSLMKKPPVVLKTGKILDGNHRLERAVEMGLDKIPVLIQL